MRLLPVPGPPVSTLTPCRSTVSTAPRWVSSRSSSASPASSGSIGSAVAVSRATASATALSAIASRCSDSVPAVSCTMPASIAATTAPGGSATPSAPQRGQHQLDRLHGVPVPGGPVQRVRDQRPAAARVVPPHAGQRGDRDPVGLDHPDVGQLQQPPRVVAQPAGGVVAERVHRPGGDPRPQPGRDDQLGHLVHVRGADPGGQQPAGADGADLGQRRPASAAVTSLGRRDPGRRQRLGRACDRPPATARRRRTPRRRDRPTRRTLPRRVPARGHLGRRRRAAGARVGGRRRWTQADHAERTLLVRAAGGDAALLPTGTSQHARQGVTRLWTGRRVDERRQRLRGRGLESSPRVLDVFGLPGT